MQQAIDALVTAGLPPEQVIELAVPQLRPPTVDRPAYVVQRTTDRPLSAEVWCMLRDLIVECGPWRGPWWMEGDKQYLFYRRGCLFRHQLTLAEVLACCTGPTPG
jgi:hypothetical protein